MKSVGNHGLPRTLQSAPDEGSDEVWPSLCLLHTVSLEPATLIPFRPADGSFGATMADLMSSDSDPMAHKVKNFTPGHGRKSVPTPALHQDLQNLGTKKRVTQGTY